MLCQFQALGFLVVAVYEMPVLLAKGFSACLRNGQSATTWLPSDRRGGPERISRAANQLSSQSAEQPFRKPATISREAAADCRNHEARTDRLELPQILSPNPDSHMNTLRNFRFLCILASVVAFQSAPLLAQEKLKALIIDGQNNHVRWPKTTVMMKSFLEESGRFEEVDIQRTKYVWNGDQKDLDTYALDDVEVEVVKDPKSDPNFKPNFAEYDVVVSNFGWNAASWPKETQVAFEKYMKSGGGLVVVHAADNSFPEWEAYNEMIGIGGWGGRDVKSGPYVYFDKEGNLVRDTSPGKGGAHGPRHEFAIVVRDTEHPIMRGLPTTWMHSEDELYERLRGPAKNMKILATAYASPEKRGSDRHEPMLMVLEYGEGRVFHTTLGHEDYSMECVGFITTFIRGCEWAATGEVTLTEVPEDFPTADEVSRRSFKK